jgi:hypothetical protein
MPSKTLTFIPGEERHYITGDESERDPGSYLCSKLDIFTDAEYFEEHDLEMRGRFEYEWKRYVKAAKRGPVRYRPEGFSDVQVAWAVHLKLTGKFPELPPRRS